MTVDEAKTKLRELRKTYKTVAEHIEFTETEEYKKLIDIIFAQKATFRKVREEKI